MIKLRTLAAVIGASAALMAGTAAAQAAPVTRAAPAALTAPSGHAAPAAPADEVVFLPYGYFASGVGCDDVGELMYGEWYGGGQVIGWDCTHLGKAPLAWLLTLEVAEGMCPNVIRGTHQAVPAKCE